MRSSDPLRPRRRLTTRSALVAASLFAAAVVPAAVGADNGTDSADLRAGVTAGGILDHLDTLQDIADANGGTRSAGTAGHVASAEYVADLLEDAGYNVTLQVFNYLKWTQLGPASFSVGATPYVENTDFAVMSYSGEEGPGAGPIQAVDLVLPPVGGSTSGCEAADFAGFAPGNVALIQRGTCTFYEKALNAENAGASAVIIFNEGNAADRTDLLFGTLGADGDPITIPVIGTTFAVGESLAAAPGSAASIEVDVDLEAIETHNVLADTKTGRTDRIVVAGGHLDSVAEGPGIQDNGSGTMALLEIALQMKDVKPRNMVRFAFWSGEEDGLIGSQYYVDQLTARDVKNHALNLNFDMIASPNFGRFIYDGDGSDSADAGPNGSAVIERVFADYFVTQGLATAPTAFDGRSDYGPFIDRGIPAGGLFTGAEDLKTAAEATVFGGTAGVAFDPCYHQACDAIANINTDALDQMSDAAAHAILTFAQTTSAVNGTGKGSSDTIDFERQGSHYIK